MFGFEGIDRAVKPNFFEHLSIDVDPPLLRGRRCLLGRRGAGRGGRDLPCWLSFLLRHQLVNPVGKRLGIIIRRVDGVDFFNFIEREFVLLVLDILLRIFQEMRNLFDTLIRAVLGILLVLFDFQHVLANSFLERDGVIVLGVVSKGLLNFVQGFIVFPLFRVYIRCPDMLCDGILVEVGRRLWLFE